jgi:Flp pilus assembly protein TadD
MQETGDRFTYIPHVGLFVAIAWLAADLVAGRDRLRMLLGAGAGSAIAIAALLAGEQTRVWRNTETLFTHALEMAPAGNGVAHRVLVRYYMTRGELARARIHAISALQIDRSDIQARLQLGRIEMLAGRPDSAAREFEQVVSLGGGRFPVIETDAHANLGLLRSGRGDWEGAVRHFRDALVSSPNHPLVRVGLGVALARLGRSEEAERRFREALELSPALVEAHSEYGALLLDLGRRDEGLLHLRKALELRPGYPPAVERLRSASGVAP